MDKYTKEDLSEFLNYHCLHLNKYEMNVIGMLIYLQTVYNNIKNGNKNIYPFDYREWEVNKNGPVLPVIFEHDNKNNVNEVLTKYIIIVDSILIRDIKIVISRYRTLPIFTYNLKDYNSDNEIRELSIFDTLKRIPKDKLTILSLLRKERI